MTNERLVRTEIVQAWAMGEDIADELTKLSPVLGYHLNQVLAKLDLAIEMMDELEPA